MEVVFAKFDWMCGYKMAPREGSTPSCRALLILILIASVRSYIDADLLNIYSRHSGPYRRCRSTPARGVDSRLIRNFCTLLVSTSVSQVPRG